jgi:hypothetical protein
MSQAFMKPTSQKTRDGAISGVFPRQKHTRGPILTWRYLSEFSNVMMEKDGSHSLSEIARFFTSHYQMTGSGKTEYVQ